MKLGPSFQPGRVFGLGASALLAGAVGMCAHAATSLRRVPAAAPSPAYSHLPRPLSSYQISDLPTQRISPEQAQSIVLNSQTVPIAANRGARANASGPTPPAVTQQFYDLTTNPRPPLVGPSTPCAEIHPMWSWDQQSIYFASNNVDAIGAYGTTTPAGNAAFHVYRMGSDGSFVQQITGTTITGESTGNQLYPAVNHSQTKLAYVHRNTASDPYELYVLDFFTGKRTQVTGVSVSNSPVDNSSLTSVQRPAWDPGDGLIAFAARNKNVANDPLNIYVVDTVTLVVRKLTAGTASNGVECKDPIFHPSASIARIAFSANAGDPSKGPAINGSTGDLNYIANPQHDFRGVGSTQDLDHNIFTVPLSGPTAGNPIQQLTSDIADDIEPSYDQSSYPVGSNPPAGPYNDFLAFSSLGRTADGTAATQRGNTYDIYFTNGNPETSGNLPIRLFTPDTNAGSVPLNKTDEHYPTWSASLPPQNPIDRIAFSSNTQLTRQNPNDPNSAVVQTVGAATQTDIWAAEVTDITPPTVFMFDDQAGEVLHITNAPLPNVGRRLGSPGDTFYFYAKVLDGQYGVESVWAQIKDPDGPSTDSNAVNHRLYGHGTFPNGGTGSNNNVFSVRWKGPPFVTTNYLHIPYETDFDGIGVSDYQYYHSDERFDPGQISTEAPGFGGANAQFASLDPGVDDSVAWSGNQTSTFWQTNFGAPWTPTPMSNRPPLDVNGNNRWLRLRDDGVFPDLVAGDGIYSAQWVTPNDPSDYYVDLIAYDKAYNPKDPTQQGNWIIYDNIWGFSTQRLVSTNPVLYVDDNGAGQKWPRGLKGLFRPFPQFRYGTESEVIDRDTNYYPKEVLPVPGATATTPPTPPSLSDINNAGGGRGTYDFLTNSAGVNFLFGVQAYHYDLWRVLAKGPVPADVLDNYTPTTDNQPLDIQGKTTIDRPVPRRAVLWNSPYTGDIFMGAGSILDQATQTLLTNYRSRAGRLMIAGGDILWALTVAGTTPSAFAQTVLGADYAADEGTAGILANQNYSPFQNGPIGLNITEDAADRHFAKRGNPPYWGPLYNPDPLGTQTSWASTISNGFTVGNSDWTSATDGAPFRTQDVLKPRAGWEEVFQGRMVAQNDAATQSKTVFMCASLGSMGRRYTAQDDASQLDCLNYRAKISHAMFCWMFSADLVGQVRTVNGGAPVSGAWVQAYQGGQLVGSAFSRPDGTYTIRGLPVGGWNIQVNNPGYLAFNKATGSGAHGLDQSQLDVLLTPAAPGSISGSVTDTTGAAVPNATVHATLQASPLYAGVRDFFATSGSDGKYVIPSAPVGTYSVSIDPPYPTGFNNPQPASQSATVNPAQDTPNINFVMTPTSGPLQVIVYRQQADGTKGSPLAGADVTLLDKTGTLLAEKNTDSAGRASFTAIPPGQVTITGFKPGFQEASTVINIPQQQTPVELILPTAAPQLIYGEAIRQVDNKPVTSADLNPAITLQLLRKVSQQPIGTTTNVFAPPQTLANPPTTYNYSFNTFEGNYTIALRNHPRFQDAQVDVVVTANAPAVAGPLTLVGKPGVLSGVAVEDQGGGKVGPALDSATVTVINQANSQTTTVTTASDGSFSTPSIPSGLYTISITKFGYTTSVTRDIFVAGDTNVGQILVQRMPRGQIYGLAQRLLDRSPEPNVTVEFWTTPTSPFGHIKVAQTNSLPADPVTGKGQTTIGPDGQPENYSLGDILTSSDILPAGDYEVHASNDPRFSNFIGIVTVNPSVQTRFDLKLTSLPGVLSGTVRENIGTASSPVAGPPVAGATVQLTLNGQTAATLTTDANGNYKTSSAVAAGQYTVTGSAFGFFTTTLPNGVFVEGPTTAGDLLMLRQPPSHVRGQVVSAVDNAPIGDVTISLIPQGGNSTGTPTAISTDTLSGNPPGNFDLFPVVAGTYVAQATKAGWQTVTSSPFTISPAVDKTNLVFKLQPQHTFGTGLLLISLPDDFSGQDAAAVLGKDSASFKSAIYQPDQGGYAIYPAAPANEFKLGRGMFVRFTQPTAFAKAGAAAPNAPYSIPVKSGWNMIGSVRHQRVEWLSVQVATADGQTLTMQQAMNAGIIQNGLFFYVDSYFRSDYMDPFVGYFVRAFQDCTLIVPTSSTASAVTAEERAQVAAHHPAPSTDQVAREIDAAGMGPGRYQRQMPSDDWKDAPLSTILNTGWRSTLPGRLTNPHENLPWRRGLG